MPNLITYLGLNKKNFDQGLNQAMAEAQSAGLGLTAKLVNPWTIATAAVAAFAAKVGLAFKGMVEQAGAIKAGAALTNLDPQVVQKFTLAGVSAETLARGIEHIAKAQQAVQTGGPGAKDALENFSQFGITVRDIEKLSYQDLFVKMTTNMNLAKMSGAQLTAGVELMGKSFDDLQVAAKKGLDEVTNLMNSLDDEQIKTLNNLTKSVKDFALLTTRAFLDLAGGILKVFNWVDAHVPDWLKPKGYAQVSRSDDILRGQKDLNALSIERIKKHDEANRKELEATFQKAKAQKELHHTEATHRERVSGMIGTDLTASQRIGGYVAGNSLNSIQNMALKEAQTQTVILRDIHRELMEHGGTVDHTGALVPVGF